MSRTRPTGALREELAGPLPVIAVVIPAYRAANHIQTVLAGIPGFVTYIIVVDDASPDNTAELVEAWPDPRVRLIRRHSNGGVGAAMLTGYQAALELGAEIIVKMDSDNQMDPEFLLPLITPIALGQADYTKGNRFLHARQLTRMPLVRRLGNVGLSFLTKLASGYWNIFDPTNGYTAIHAEVLSMLDRGAIARGYLFETSMLLELSLIDAVVRDVYMPARYQDEVSSLSVWKSLRVFPAFLFRGLVHRLVVKYIVRDFSAVSLLLLAGLIAVGFGTSWGAYHWYMSATLGNPASTGTVMLAVTPVVVGLQFLLEALVLDIQNVPRYPIHLERKRVLSRLTDN